MPVKLSPRSGAENEARIEIIPLIDIMFFLLAAFMLVSLSMVKMRSVKVDLPTATVSTPDTRRDLVNISVDKSGMAFLDAKPIANNELVILLSGLRKHKMDSALLYRDGVLAVQIAGGQIRYIE